MTCGVAVAAVMVPAVVPVAHLPGDSCLPLCCFLGEANICVGRTTMTTHPVEITVPVDPADVLTVEGADGLSVGCIP
jgi:hypothetical protein